MVNDGTYRKRNCSICNAPNGYIVQNGKAFYDTNCDCVSFYTAPQEVPMEEVESFLAGAATKFNN